MALYEAFSNAEKMSRLYSLCILKYTFQLLRYIFPHRNYTAFSLTSIRSMNSLPYTLPGNNYENLNLPSCLLETHRL